MSVLLAQPAGQRLSRRARDAPDMCCATSVIAVRQHRGIVSVKGRQWQHIGNDVDRQHK